MAYFLINISIINIHTHTTHHCCCKNQMKEKNFFFLINFIAQKFIILFIDSLMYRQSVEIVIIFLLSQYIYLSSKTVFPVYM